MNWSLQSLHRKSAVILVILTVCVVAISIILTVFGPRDWWLAAPWAGSVLLAANTIELVRRVRRGEQDASKQLVKDEG